MNDNIENDEHIANQSNTEIVLANIQKELTKRNMAYRHSLQRLDNASKSNQKDS